MTYKKSKGVNKYSKILRN